MSGSQSDLASTDSKQHFRKRIIMSRSDHNNNNTGTVIAVILPLCACVCCLLFQQIDVRAVTAKS